MQPRLRCAPLLKSAWPIAKPCLTGELSGLPAELGAAPRSFWPAITAHAAGTALRKTAAVLDPRIGLTILMESAIYAQGRSGGRGPVGDADRCSSGLPELLGEIIPVAAEAVGMARDDAIEAIAT